MQKPVLFTDEGQRKFLKIRDNVSELLKKSGAVTMGKAIRGVTGDVWDSLACVDRMVELGEIREVHYGECAGQDRIFVSARE